MANCENCLNRLFDDNLGIYHCKFEPAKAYMTDEECEDEEAK